MTSESVGGETDGAAIDASEARRRSDVEVRRARPVRLALAALALVVVGALGVSASAFGRQRRDELRHR